MKTSNKLLIAVTIALIGYLVVYDLALKAEYDKGEFKSRYYKMTKINIKDFNAIQNNLGNYFGIDVEYGPEYGVWVNDDVKDEMKFSKKGKTLQIDFDNQHEDYHYGGRMVIITSPVLDSVNTFMPKQHQYQNFWTSLKITGFKQQAMKLSVGEFTKVYLENNTLNQLDALVQGVDMSDTFDDGLTIAKNNTIKVANITTPKESRRAHIKLIDPTIDKVNYDLSDSTSLTVSGRLLHALR